MDLAVANPAHQWVEVTVPANAESVESVSELLSEYGYNQGIVIEEPYKQDDDGDNLEIDPTRPVLVRTWLSMDEQYESRRAALERAVWHLRQIGGVGEATFVTREEEDWANAWKEHFQILRIGTSFVVRPSWREYDALPGDRVIHLDPGMAFGTGLHPSTEMCMLFTEELDLTGLDVLDVGAGSGILSIGAIRSGARHATAVEIDPVAARSLAENVQLNDMQDRIDVVTGAVGDVELGERVYPLVYANIIARILADNAEHIARYVAPGGHVIASGIIDEREHLVVDAFAALGCAVIGRKQAGDWVALLLHRR